MANEKTVELMRDNLRPLFEKTETAHAGLLIQRGLKKWEDGEKPTKQALIKKIADDVQVSELYFLAFKRWLRHTYHTEDDTNFFATGASLTGRLFMGLPLGGTLETGVSTNHTYGVPMIAGSSVKGAVRAYTEQLFAKRKDSGEIDFEKRKNKNGTETLHYQFDDDKQAIINVLFGADDNSDAGYLIWHDAWWIPKATSKGELSRGEQNKPFAPEVVTVHHQKYYNGKLTEALDIENPVPNQQLAVEGGFYFVIEGVPAWAAYAGTLLKKALNEQGLGAKSGSGYGYFVVDNDINANLNALYNKILGGNTNDPLAMIAFLSADELVEKLSKGINGFLTDLGFDKENEKDRQSVAQAVLKHHAHIVDSWADSNSKNAKKAYRFVTENRQKP